MSICISGWESAVILPDIKELAKILVNKSPNLIWDALEVKLDIWIKFIRQQKKVYYCKIDSKCPALSWMGICWDSSR